MVEEGADIIDIGGVSTKPGYKEVDEEEELRRVIPVLEALVKEIRVPISIDTWRAKIAKEALDIGVDIINDQKALAGDTQMPEVVSEYGVPVILMHNEEINPDNDIMEELVKSLGNSIEKAISNGIAKEKIIIDPGIGFMKTYEQNLEVLRRLNELKVMGYPILLGTSRKSVIGKTLNLPENDRKEGTAAAIAVGIINGVDIVRVHDVKAMARVAKMTDAIVRHRED
jgi:dihydropteroate synthase